MISFVSYDGFSEPLSSGDETYAELRVYEHLLKHIRLTGTENTPYLDDGLTVRPSMTFQGQSRILTSQNQIAMEAQISLNGTAKSGKTERVNRRRVAGANTTSHLTAQFSKSVYFNGNSVQSGALRGTPEINVDITTHNNFPGPILRRIAHRRAHAQAQAKVRVKVPQEKAKLTSQITAVANQAISQTNQVMRENLTQMDALIKDVKTLPFNVQLNSRATGQYMGHVGVKVKGTGKKFPAAKNLDHYRQLATSFKIREETIEDTITPQIAGKQMKMVDVKNIICDKRFGRVLDFCRKEMPVSTQLTSILFDENQPIDIEFKDNKITLKLNAIYQVHPEVKATEDGRLLTEPTDPESLTFGKVPYTVTISYQIDSDGAKRDHLSVTERSPQSIGGDKSENNTHSDNSLSWSQRLMKPLVKQQIHSAFDQALKEEIRVPNISFPLEASVTNPKSGGKPILSRAGSLLHLETKAEDGWLVTGQYFCAEGMSSLGLSFQPYIDGSGVEKLRITKVADSSPAFLTGFRVGDSIATFGAASEATSQKASRDYRPFINFINQSSDRPTSQERTIKLSGSDVSGKPFEKEVILCPKSLDHRSEAEKIIANTRAAIESNR